MKERPIIFSTDMVKAILEGRKTQTRRIIKSQPIGRFGGISERVTKAHHCPYGQAGDRLWVRETFCLGHDIPFYFAELGDKITPYSGRWIPSIHMPRWASRITLEITEVRVERLEEITEEDAKSEGCWGTGAEGAIDEQLPLHSAVFGKLWDSLNAKRGYGWSVNPWVWVIEFRQATK